MKRSRWVFSFFIVCVILIREPITRAEEIDSIQALRRLSTQKKYEEVVALSRAVLKQNTMGGMRFQYIDEMIKALVYLGKRDEAFNFLNEEKKKVSETQRESIAQRYKVISQLFAKNENFQIYQTAFQALREKRFKEAENGFLSVLKNEKHHPEVMFRLGQTYVFEKEADQAIETFKSVINLTPDHGDLYSWLGAAHLLKGELNEAKRLLSLGRRAQPTERNAIWLSQLMILSQQAAEARKLLAKDLEEQKNHVFVGLELAVLESSRPILDRMERLGTQSGFSFSDSLYSLREFREAVEKVKNQISKTPQ